MDFNGLSRCSIRIRVISFSILQSLQKGQPTEIDYLNGEIVRLGRVVGLPVPINTRIIELVQEIEKTRQFYPPETLTILFALVPK
jgi:2-dehydropantoate 2-reductase